MRLAYAILVHRDPEQVARLVRTLSGPETSFFIHVDRRVDQSQFAAAIGSSFDVTWVEPRFAVKLFSYDVVEAELACLAAALASSAKPRYISILSGQTYPLRSPARFEQFLAEHDGRQFIETIRVGPDFFGNRVDRYYFHHVASPIARRVLNKLGSFVRRKPIMPMYGGSMWATLTRDCAEYLLQSLHSGSRLARYLRHTHVPDELFIQTTVMNSPFAGDVVNDSLHYIRWANGEAHPHTFHDADFDDLMNSGKWFGRKFDRAKSPDLLERIDRAIGAETPQTIPAQTGA